MIAITFLHSDGLLIPKLLLFGLTRDSRDLLGRRGRRIGRRSGSASQPPPTSSSSAADVREGVAPAAIAPARGVVDATAAVVVAVTGVVAVDDAAAAAAAAAEIAVRIELCQKRSRSRHFAC